MVLAASEAPSKAPVLERVVPGATSLGSELLGASGEPTGGFYPWQQDAFGVMMDLEGDKWKWREVAIVVSRQNGKTQLLPARILWGLSRGERILHTAQNRILPRGTFRSVAANVTDAVTIRHANGQEEIRTRSGGSYMIIAPQKSVRGHSADLLIIDEVREFEDFDFIAAAEPTLVAAPNPQVLYLSNAGEETSIVLNDLKQRAGTDPNLAYLEWSAAAWRMVDDEEGWLEANPAIPHSEHLTLDRLRQIYEKYRLSGELAKFETEHLCRWVLSMAPRLVADPAWQMCRREVEDPQRPVLGISVDPSGHRVSAVLAWPQSDGSIGVMGRGFTGNPVDLTRLAADLAEQVKTLQVETVAYDPWTDQHLARHFPNAKPITGQEFANASERFVRAVETQQLRWQHADPISGDLPYASRKTTAGTAWVADRAKADRSISGVLAAIRAVWVASNPQVLRPILY